MHNIDKFLKKISAKKRVKLIELVENIEKNDLDKLDCKKLKGIQNIFRIRKGDLRILFKKEVGQNTILSIEKRSDDTYSL